MAGTTELLKRLDSDGEPFAKRLCLAQNVFQSMHLPLPRKEESVTYWLCQAADKFKEKRKRKSLSISSDDFVKLWSTLHTCITNQKFESANLRPSTKVYIIEVLSKQLKRKDLSHQDAFMVLECAITVFKTKSFAAYFSTDASLCVDFANNLLKSMSVECAEHLPLIRTCLITFQNLSKSKDDLRLKFLDEMLFTLSNMLKSDKSHPSIHHDIYKCVMQVLFPQTSSDFFEFLRDNIMTLASSEKQYPVPTKLLTVLEAARSSLEEDSYITLLTMICSSFDVSQNDDKSRSSYVFPMYVCITYLAGFEVKKEESAVSYKNLSQICGKGELKTMSLEFLCNMIQLLGRKPSVLTYEINGTSFRVWLKALVESLFATSSIDPASLLKLMSSMVESFPVIVESNIKNAFAVIMAKPLSEDLKPGYSTFLCKVFALYNKLSRSIQFTTCFIESLQGGFKKQQDCGILPPSQNMWLPPTFNQQLVEAATVMQSATSSKILNFLLSQLEASFLPGYTLLEGGFKNLLLHTICELISAIFRGVRLLELSTIDLARRDFCAVMKKLSQQLGEFGQFVIKVDENDFLLISSFLNASYHWAAQAILIEQYADAGREELLQAVGTNLRTECKDLSDGSVYSYLHPYLTHSQWETIYDKAVNFDNEECTSLLIKLDFQLLSALLMFNSSQSTLPKVVAKRACALMVQKLTDVHQLIDCNSVSNVITIARHLDVSELSSLGDCLIASLIANQNNDNLLNNVMSLLTEERLIACGLVCSLFKSLRRRVKASKRKKDDSGVSLWKTAKAVLGKLDAEVVIQQELLGNTVSEELGALLSSMASPLSEALSSLDGCERQFSAEECDLTNLSQHLRILRSFPLVYFTTGCQDVVFLSLLSLAVDCLPLASSQTKSDILQEIFDHLLLGLYEKGKHQSPNLKGYIDHEALVGALAYFVVHHNVGSRLLELLLDQALHQEQLLDQILKRIKVIKNEGKEETLSKENILLGTLFLKVSSGIKLKSMGSLESSVNLDNESATNTMKKVNKARKKIAKTFGSLIQRQLVKNEVGLQAFTLCLEFNMSLEKGIENLPPEFETFCRYAVSSLHSSERAEIKAAESFILTVCRHRQNLNSAPEFLIKDVWSHLTLSDQPNEAILKATILAATGDEISFIIDDLLSKTQNLKYDDMISFDKVLSKTVQIWSMLLRTKNLNVIQKSLIALKDMFRLEQLGKVSPKLLLGFLNGILLSQVKLNLQDMDLCFLILHDVKWSEDHPILVPAARQFVSVLSAIFLHRFSLALDCVPSFMQMLQLLVNKLAKASRQSLKLSSTESAELAGIAFETEKLVTAFTKPLAKKSLRRVAAYFIADLISIFETTHLCSSVKKHFENMVYALMSIMDDHALKFLLRIMSPSSTEIFKNLQSSYNKFHLFKGKF